MSTTLQRLAAFVANDHMLPAEGLHLDIDSPGTVEPMGSIEDAFGIEPAPEPAPAATLGDVVRQVAPALATPGRRAP